MAYNLARLKRAKGNRRRVIKLRPIKPTLTLRRRLELIILEMVEFVYSHAPDLLRAMPEPGVTRDAPADDIDRLIQLIITQTSGVMTRLRVRVREWSAESEAAHRRRWQEAVEAGTGVDIGTQLHPEAVSDVVANSLARNVGLIRDVGDEARKRIADIVLAAVQERKAPRDIAADIQAAEEMSRRRALNIAADQSNKLNAALDRERQKEAGINGFIWRHSGKVHARPEHLARDGEFFEWETPDIEPGDFPGEPPFCGCVAQAALIDEEPSPGDAPDDLDLEDSQ